jgi:hypothetical protein
MDRSDVVESHGAQEVVEGDQQLQRRFILLPAHRVNTQLLLLLLLRFAHA